MIKAIDLQMKLGELGLNEVGLSFGSSLTQSGDYIEVATPNKAAFAAFIEEAGAFDVSAFRDAKQTASKPPPEGYPSFYKIKYPVEYVESRLDHIKSRATAIIAATQKAPDRLNKLADRILSSSQEERSQAALELLTQADVSMKMGMQK